MTPKDIRDIAAYWGAPATIGEKTVTDRIGSDGETVRFVRGGVVISWGHMLSLLHQHWRDGVSIKLQLRPLSSLTDDEVRNIVEIAEEDSVIEIHRFETRIETGPISIDWHQKEFVYLNYGDHSDDAAKNPAAIAAYLQSIGVYVPGTIDPQYVELQP